MRDRIASVRHRARLLVPGVVALTLASALLVPGSAEARTRPVVFIRWAPAKAVVVVKPTPLKPHPLKRVWVPGHWKLNRLGNPVWVRGHWRFAR